jgi:hypothetical protein
VDRQELQIQLWKRQARFPCSRSSGKLAFNACTPGVLLLFRKLTQARRWTAVLGLTIVGSILV